MTKEHKSPCKILVMNVSKCKLAQVAPPWSRINTQKMGLGQQHWGFPEWVSEMNVSIALVSAQWCSHCEGTVSSQIMPATSASLCLGIKTPCAEVEQMLLSRTKRPPFRSGTNAPSQNTTATVKGKRPLKFQSVVNSMYETDGINLWQYITLKMLKTSTLFYSFKSALNMKITGCCHFIKICCSSYVSFIEQDIVKTLIPVNSTNIEVSNQGRVYDCNKECTWPRIILATFGSIKWKENINMYSSNNLR